MRINEEVSGKALGTGQALQCRGTRSSWNSEAPPQVPGQDPQEGTEGTDPRASHPWRVQALPEWPPGGPLTWEIYPSEVRSHTEGSSEVVW